ncbi:glutathione-independent formaldehyde dehydrogenase [Methylovorus glucosotrophus]|nr:glutathione-independent formaldehyde dehydrogenase [Methylovorus glucosotrophus]
MAECFLHSLMQLIWASFLLSACHASWQAALQIHPTATPGWRLQGLAPYAISIMQLITFRESTMRALTYHGSKDVRIETVPDPIIQEPDDVILRVTATAICGSDLHIYRGKIPMVKDGDILGHEFMGVVEDVGKDVVNVKKGDRVIIPFVIACGDCFFCQKELYAACETTNTGRGAILNKKELRPSAALFGYSHLYGGVPGGQAELVRVPKGNVGPFKINGSLADEQVLFLTDILPTGYQAAEYAHIRPGSSVAIFGAGPVGLMAAASARLMGAETIFMVDHHAYRLAYAEAQYNTISINFEDVDPAEVIIQNTSYRGVDAVIDAVGFEAKGSTLETVMANLKIEGSSGKALRQCIAAVRRGGVVSVPGVYAGFIHGFLFGDAFDKGLTFKMGQTHVQRYLPKLLEHIENGDLRPADIITHRMSLEDAVKGYEIFNNKEEDCRKVVLTPG